MKYNVGDKVRIKSIDWYNENKNHCGEIPLFKSSGLFVPDMSRYCNNIMTIKDICYGTCYRMKEDFWNYNWTDEMIEGLVEEETKPKYEDEVNGEYYSTPKYLVRPSGYQFVDENGNVINATKIVLEKKKKEYPKTLEECCEVLDTGGYQIDYFVKPGEVYEYEKALITKISALYNLIICRDAYWQLYGEEMKLGKPWEPDFTDKYSKSYVITAASGIIHTTWANKQNYVLAFPTEEMRDAFYENFKSEIEFCKEFL